MTLGANTLLQSSDSLLDGLKTSPTRSGDHIASLLASLGLHALFITLLIFEVLAPFQSPIVQETVVDVVSETLPEPVTPPPAPPRQQQAKPSGIPAIADEDKKSNAMQGALERNSDGQDRKDEGGSTDGTDRHEQQTALPLAHHEQAELASPERSMPEAHRKARIAPAGDQRAKAVTRRPDQAAKDAEAAKKRHEVQCDANAGRNPSWGTVRRGTVLAALGAEQARQAMERNQMALNLHISPAYVSNPRIALHVDGAPPAAWVIVLLPGGMAVHAGDHLEYRMVRLDPSKPCHYIPNLAMHVL